MTSSMSSSWLMMVQIIYSNLFHFHFQTTFKQFLLNQLCVMSLFSKRERSLIFSGLKTSTFLSQMLLSNFLIWWSWNILNKTNISMMLSKCLIRRFWVDVTSKAHCSFTIDIIKLISNGSKIITVKIFWIRWESRWNYVVWESSFGLNSIELHLNQDKLIIQNV